MELKEVSIKPIDNDILTRVEAVRILNDFKMRGFATRSSFIGVVSQNIERFKDFKNLDTLFRFWIGRLKSPEVNEELCKLLQQLKNE